MKKPETILVTALILICVWLVASVGIKMDRKLHPEARIPPEWHAPLIESDVTLWPACPVAGDGSIVVRDVLEEAVRANQTTQPNNMAAAMSTEGASVVVDFGKSPICILQTGGYVVMKPDTFRLDIRNLSAIVPDGANYGFAIQIKDPDAMFRFPGGTK